MDDIGNIYTADKTIKSFQNAQVMMSKIAQGEPLPLSTSLTLRNAFTGKQANPEQREDLNFRLDYVIFIHHFYSPQTI